MEQTQKTAENYFSKYLDRPMLLKKLGDSYSKRIGTVYNFDFGCEGWMTDLKWNLDNKLMTDYEYNEMRKFGEMARAMLCQTDRAKDVRWFYLDKWIKSVSGYTGRELTPDSVSFYEQRLEERKRDMPPEEYLMIWYAFQDIKGFKERTTQRITEEYAAKMTVEEKQQKAKGRSFLICLLIIIFEPLPFCIIAQDILSGILLWGLCSPVAVPLTFIIAMLVSDHIAEATVGLTKEEQTDDYKAMKNATKAGLVTGGISAGIGCLQGADEARLDKRFQIGIKTLKNINRITF